MTLYSSGLFSVLTASGCIDNALALPVSPSLEDEKTLAFGTTIHFVRDSKFRISFNSHLDSAGEISVLSPFVDNGFDTDSALKKGLAFEIQAYRYSGFDGLYR